MFFLGHQQKKIEILFIVLVGCSFCFGGCHQMNVDTKQKHCVCSLNFPETKQFVIVVDIRKIYIDDTYTLHTSCVCVFFLFALLYKQSNISLKAAANTNRERKLMEKKKKFKSRVFLPSANILSQFTCYIQSIEYLIEQVAQCDDRQQLRLRCCSILDLTCI